MVIPCISMISSSFTLIRSPASNQKQSWISTACSRQCNNTADIFPSSAATIDFFATLIHHLLYLWTSMLKMSLIGIFPIIPECYKVKNVLSYTIQKLVILIVAAVFDKARWHNQRCKRKAALVTVQYNLPTPAACVNFLKLVDLKPESDLINGWTATPEAFLETHFPTSMFFLSPLGL